MNESCNNNTQQTVSITVLCIALIIMTSQSVILGFIYYRWKKSHQNHSSDRRRTILNPVRRHRSNRSDNSATNNRAETPSRPAVPEPQQIQILQNTEVEYAEIVRNNQVTIEDSEPIYLNQPSNQPPPPAPKVKITKKTKNNNNKPTPPQTLAVTNELYADMEALTNESGKRTFTPLSPTNQGSSDMASIVVDNDVYFNTGTINERPTVPERKKK